MKRLALLLVLASATAYAGVPTTLNFTARLTDDKTGKEIVGTHHLQLSLFDAETDGNMLYFEGRDITVEDGGLVFVDIGEVKPLDSAIFDGKKLFLEVTVDDVTMDPRVGLSSVPYAVRSAVASDSDKVGGLAASQLQQRVSGTCSAGSFFTSVNTDGTVNCMPAGSGNGTITSILAGPGLQGGGTTGAVTLGMLSSCAQNELLKWNGATWACASDLNSGGDITGVLIGPAGGIIGGGTSGDVQISLPTSCASGQLLKFNGASWSCANDIDTDTNSGGTITGVTTGPNSGLVGGAGTGNVNLSLVTTCAVGQMLKWNGAGWACANDIDTDTNSGGDITDVLAGAGLTGGGSSGSVTINVGAGTGISVAADLVSLDTAFTDTRYDARYDPRYVNAAGDSMSGNLDMAQNHVVNRGCPTGHVRAGPGLCTEFTDGNGFTFAGCANRCRAQGTHMCSSGEMRAVMLSGVSLDVGGVLLDWVDDQDAVGAGLFVNSTANADTLDASRVTTSSSFCRCCANVE